MMFVYASTGLQLIIRTFSQFIFFESTFDLTSSSSATLFGEVARNRPTQRDLGFLRRLVVEAINDFL
jgi:hypothetical protein